MKNSKRDIVGLVTGNLKSLPDASKSVVESFMRKLNTYDLSMVLSQNTIDDILEYIDTNEYQSVITEFIMVLDMDLGLLYIGDVEDGATKDRLYFTLTESYGSMRDSVLHGDNWRRLTPTAVVSEEVVDTFMSVILLLRVYGAAALLKVVADD